MSDYNESVITPLDRGAAWWSTGKKNSRKTALGATSIVVLLALISWLVWMSPSDNVVRKVVGDVVKPIATNVQLKNDRANLLSQLVSSKSTMSNQQSALEAQRSALATAEGKAASLQKQLSAAKAGEAKAEGQASSLRAQLTGDPSGGGATSVAGNAVGIGPASATSGGPSSGTPVQPGTGTGGGTGSTTGPVTVQVPKLADIIDPKSKYFGLYTQQSPFNWAETDEVAEKLGVEPNVSGYFQGFDSDFRPDAVQRAWAKGDLPMMTWESQPLKSVNNMTDQSPYELSKIAGGDFDAYLTKYAKDIVANGQPLAIRLDQEMNADWYPWGEGTNHNSKGEFKAMWIHVHDIFAAQGANKYVAWVWSPNRVDNLQGQGQQTLAYLNEYYPGPRYVDWVGMSAYLRPPYSTSETYSFDHTFQKTLDQLRQIAKGKPIMLSEIGASENGGQKAKWTADLFKNLALPGNSDIVGFGWFNHTVTSTTNKVQYTNDWRITSSQSSINAFKNGMASVATTYRLKSVQ